jgi:hypothetical protein
MKPSNQKKKRTPVLITNPAGGSPFTNLARAERYQRRGLCRLWKEKEGWRMEFLTKTARSAAITASARLSMDQINYDRASGTGTASLKAIKGLPIAGPAIILLTRRQKKAAA